jgi:hypothetical protein
MLVYGWNKTPVDGGINSSLSKYVVVVVHKQMWDATTHTGRRAEVAGASCLTFFVPSTSRHVHTPHNNRKELGFTRNGTPVIEREECEQK